MFSPQYDLAIFELAVYLILIFVVIYIFFRHGRPGWDAWGFLAIFCMLRIVAAGLQLSDQTGTSPTAALVNSIGMSGLLLGCMGVVLECANCIPSSNPKILTIIGILFHLVIVTAIALSASGISAMSDALANHQPVPSGARGKQLGGYALLLLSVIFLMGYTYFTNGRLRNVVAATKAGTATHPDYSTPSAPGARAAVLGSRLLLFVVLALPFIIVRVLYSFIGAVTQDPNLSMFGGSFGIQLVMVTLMQLFAILLLIAGGLASTGIHEVAMTKRQVEQAGSADSDNSMEMEQGDVHGHGRHGGLVEKKEVRSGRHEDRRARRH